MLYAVWQAHTYTISYNANGGTGAPGNQTKTYGVNLTLSSTKPTRTNYNFLGWATSASATSPQYAAGGTYSANSGVTLYAVWQLAYTKPRINGLSVERCTEDGTAEEEGTYARVSFAWATDRAVSSITVTWTSVMGGSGSTNIPTSGTSGNVSFVFGGGNLSADATYTVAVSVSDSGGSTPASTTLSSIKYTIDFLQGGKGAAFFKAAEREGLEVNNDMRVSGSITASSLNGIFMTSVDLFAESEIKIKSHFPNFSYSGDSRQMFFIFGRDSGIVTLTNNGSASFVRFAGTGEIASFEAMDEGIFKVIMSRQLYDTFVIMSGEQFTIE